MTSPGRTKRMVRFAIPLVVLAVIGAGCGDGDSSASGDEVSEPSASTSASKQADASRPPAAKDKAKEKEKSSGGTKEALVKALKDEPDAKEIPGRARDIFADCLADVIIKYGKADSIEKYIDGKIKLDAIDGASGEKAEKEGFACAEKAYQNA